MLLPQAYSSFSHPHSCRVLQPKIQVPLTVYYSPNIANKKVVPILDALGKGKFVFVPLTDSLPDRIQQLPSIEGRVAFLWGDGYRHHESFYFTSRRGIDTKMNIDQHHDALISGKLNCGNHMHHSRIHNIHPVTGLDSASKLDSLAASDSMRASCGKVALTVDCDSIIGFPAIHEWISPEPGLLVDDVVRFMPAFGPKLDCLDLGGLVEFLPDFNFVPNPVVPNLADLRLFTKPFAIYRLWPIYNSDRDRTTDYVHFASLTSGLDQSAIDNICSYAVRVYYQLLSAFADAVQYRN